MNHSNPWKAYRQVATETAPPGQLVLMLYDGALRFLSRALTGFQMEDPADSNETIHNNIVRTQQILRELDGSLNLEAGGELAATLRRIYQYLDMRLMRSNFKKEPSGIEEALERLTVLRDAWATMLSGTGENVAQPAPTAPKVEMAAA